MEIIAITISIIGTFVTLIVLLLTRKDINMLKSHQLSLKEHEEKLNTVRPLYSNLITDENEIMELAISSTEESKEIYSLGSISSLKSVEKFKNEKEEEFVERTKNTKQSSKEYIKAIRNYILEGKEYYRIINFLAIDKEEDFNEIYCNMKFFVRLMEFDRQSEIKLKLYHNSEILSDSGNYHFRCSDKKVIIRIGGHGNNESNSAITITDTKVIDEFKNYYCSLTNSAKTVELSYSLLQEILTYMESNNLDKIQKLLKK